MLHNAAPEIRMRRFQKAVAVTVLVGLCWPAWGNELVPTGTLRATFPALNPVQARTDPATRELRGPAVELTREIARQLGVPYKITGVATISRVIESVKRGDADIGFIGFDPARAVDVVFSQNFTLAHSTFLVRQDAPFKSVADVDRAGARVGVAARSATDLVLARTLKNAALKRNTGGDVAVGGRLLLAGEIDAYASLRHLLAEVAAKNPDLRLLPDNFNTTEQSIIISKNRPSDIDFVNRVIEEARASGLIQRAIESAGLTGVDVAPPPSVRSP
jgi:polar amino acid transport system substrate-binding protein